MISEKAHVDPSAKLGKNVTIHPFAFIDKNVEIGDNTVIMPFASVMSGARIGKDCKVFQGAIVSAEPQDFRWKGEDSFCKIGDRVMIREHVIINRSIHADGATSVGDDTFISAETHIGHDCHLAGKSVIGNGVTFAGDIEVGDCVIISSNAIIYEGSKIGDWCFIKGGCRINGNVPPFVILAHNPVVYYGVNAQVMRKYGEQFGFTDTKIDNIAKAYRHIYQSSTSVFNALKRVEADVDPSPERDNIINFIRNNDLKIVAVPVDLE